MEIWVAGREANTVHYVSTYLLTYSNSETIFFGTLVFWAHVRDVLSIVTVIPSPGKCAESLAVVFGFQSPVTQYIRLPGSIGLHYPDALVLLMCIFLVVSMPQQGHMFKSVLYYSLNEIKWNRSNSFIPSWEIMLLQQQYTGTQHTNIPVTSASIPYAKGILLFILSILL